MGKFNGCTAIGNGGGGFRVLPDSELIDCHSAYNGGPGFEVEAPSLMRQLGLPHDTDPRVLLDWLSTLIQHPPNERAEIVKNQSFWEKAGKVAPPLSVANSLLGIANSPTLNEIIRWISSWTA